MVEVEKPKAEEESKTIFLGQVLLGIGLATGSIIGATFGAIFGIGVATLMITIAAIVQIPKR